MPDHASTGIPGLDDTIDSLRLGDNVVWHVDSIADFRAVVRPFVAQALSEGRRVVYVRFGPRDSVLDDPDGVEVYHVDPDVGFERFAIDVRNTLTEIGPLGFYVFDPLVSLHDAWHSDLMVMNFFKVTCPALFQLDTIAYFALLRNQHTYATIAGIRETTQLLLDLHHLDGRLYVHPLKVWQRHSPSMFFPHLLSGGEAISITSSVATTELFATLARRIDPAEAWQRQVDRAWLALEGDADAQEAARLTLLAMLAGTRGRMAALCERWLRLVDLLAVASRMIGTGRIGGKSLGVLLGRAILEQDAQGRFAGRLEPHDSFFVGSDTFVSFLVANDLWDGWTDHKHADLQVAAAERLHGLIPRGSFPGPLREQFRQLLEHYGQAPIIVRSSSLLEDSYGSAFAGKYDSVFCANQGTPEERLAGFEDAIRTVYASALSSEALQYRADRGLIGLDEQMSILVQRVSGDHFDGTFFPQVAGVANSSNLYVWDAAVADRGMARLVVGLGTRAVDRTGSDFAKIVSLAQPSSSPIAPEDAGRYSQRKVDVLDLRANRPGTLSMDEARERAAALDWGVLVSPDRGAARRLAALGRRGPVPMVVDLNGILAGDVPELLADMLASLAEAYDHPVDIEFTLNPDRGVQRVNLVQCRPLQTRGRGGAVVVPPLDPARCLLASDGSFMGGNAALPLDLVVQVRPAVYLALGEAQRYAVARLIGRLNRRLDGRSALLIGPGRWGTRMPSLGVPTHFTELNHFAGLVETTYAEGGFRPELSYGSHFFQELVESGIFYAAVLDHLGGVGFQPETTLRLPNQLLALDPTAEDLTDLVHVAPTPGLVLHADVASQRLLVQFGG